MPKIYTYRKVIDDYTTHELVQPDYEQMAEGSARITELCTIDGVTYVSVPDSITLPEQSEQVQATLKEVTLAPELIDKIREASPHVKLMERRIAEDADIRLSRQDEMTLGFPSSLVVSPAALFTAYMDQCRAWDIEAKII